MEWLNPDDLQTSGIIQDLQTAIHTHHKMGLVTSLPCTDTTTSHALIKLDGSVIGTLTNGLSIEAVVDIRQPGLVELDQHNVMIKRSTKKARFTFLAQGMSHAAWPNLSKQLVSGRWCWMTGRSMPIVSVSRLWMN